MVAKLQKNPQPKLSPELRILHSTKSLYSTSAAAEQGLSHHLFNLFAVLIQSATTSMFPTESAGIANLAKQR